MKWSRENDFDATIDAASKKYGVPVPVIKATIAKESSFNPLIDTGSVGLMQLEVATAYEMGFIGSREDLFLPEKNIRAGVAYLAHLRKRYPDEPWDAIYAAYNSGKVRRNAAGHFVNSKGDENVEKHVVGFRKALEYFEGLETP
jgi:soluble lytic murein transglycosylase-like protein